MAAPDPRALIPRPESFTSRLRGPEVTARVGLWLAVCFGITFVTGLFSHYLQDTPGWLTFPTRPVSIYRISQGLHLICGTAAIPLLLVKLWAVFPKLFERPDMGNVRRLGVQLLERGSIAVLVAAAIFQLTTGLMNSTQWYPWSFSFRSTHFAVAWVAIGSLLVHIAVKLPLIRTALTGPLDAAPDTSGTSTVEQPVARRDIDAGESAGAPDRDREATAGAAAAVATAGTPAGLTRRGLLRSTWLATGVAALATAGSTVPWLRDISVFGVRSGDGPGGIPINKSAAAAKVTAAATDPGYQLAVVNGDRSMRFSLTDLLAMAQTSATLPIACVEGWSASGDWRGVQLRELLALVDAPTDADVTVTSLQKSGAYIVTEMQHQYAQDPLTLVALALNGEGLSIDHGFPCRLIAPGRPGVLQTKWLSRLEVQT